MANITGSLASVNSVPTEGTVLVRALTLRPGSTFAVTGEPKVAVIKAGAFVIEDVEPGPVQLTIQGNGVTHDIRVDVPERDEVDFLDLLEDVYEWEPAQISAVKLAAREARKSADEAGRIASAFRGAEQLEGWAESASGSAGAALQSAGEAAGSAEAAATSERNATQAESSTAAHAQNSLTYAGQAEAARDESRLARDTAVGAAETAKAQAETATGSAGAAAGSAAAAGESETRAAASAQTATQQADRATSEADRSKTEADRAASEAESSAVKAVAEKVDELLAGAPEAYDTLLEIAEELERSQSVEAVLVKEIAGKAPLGHTHTAEDVGAAPATHTHTVGDVTGLQPALDGKAAASHTHAIADTTGLQSALDGKANKDYVDKRTPKVSAVTKLPDVQDPDTVYLVLEG